MCVCAYVCMCAGVYVCAYVRADMHVGMCVCVCMYIYIYVRTVHTYMSASSTACTHVSWGKLLRGDIVKGSGQAGFKPRNTGRPKLTFRISQNAGIFQNGCVPLNVPCINLQPSQPTHPRTHAQTQRHKDTQRHTDTQTHRHPDTQTRRHTDTQTHRHTDTRTHARTHTHLI